jgi:hypothetical protein
MSCGFSQNKKIHSMNNVVMNTVFATSYKTIHLYTAYMGRVSVNIGVSTDPNTVLMECKVGLSNITVREIDAETSRVDPNTMPSLRSLSYKPPAIVNIAENKETFYQIQLMELQKATQAGNQNSIIQHKKALEKFCILEPVLSIQLKNRYANNIFDNEQLRALYVKCGVVDVHFNTCLMLQFLQEKLNRTSVNNGNILLSICNVKSLDNAFFTGEYMVYGNGKDYFYPLMGMDVCAHELTHGLVSSTAGLIYESESGALNESFADCIATAFEHWLYQIFNTDKDLENDLQGEADWLIGENLGITMKYLRDLRNPESMKQPKIYRGKFWANTRDTSQQGDNGGVHINSGVGNHCFYLLSQKINIENALMIFYNCLLKLNSRSNYRQYSNTMYEMAPEKFKFAVRECLKLVNLDPVIVSQPPTPQPIPSNPKDVPFPNVHIPTYGQCCAHCLSRQNPKKRAIDNSPLFIKSIRSKRMRKSEVPHET